MKMVSDEQVYSEIGEELSKEDIEKTQRVILAWADALEELGEVNNIRIVFLSCINTIGTMGPAYCRIAAATLLGRAKELERDS